MIGKVVSHYRVVGKIGSGGMGVVYRAEDIRLGRHVALKFLPDEVATDPLALERFRREARTASAINHPNICTVYDIGEYEGRPFLAMELLEGETLSAHNRGPRVPAAQVVKWAEQIADALEAAHSKGVIHRDLKPANIFITTRNQVKILDFGLAKLTADRQVWASGTPGPDSETRALETSPGTAMGTLSYMSPEQARGEELDARTDLFSFGAVLYEMAAGQPAFRRQTQALVFDAILNRDPEPVAALNPETPAELVRMIGHALEKDRARRYQSAAEMHADLAALHREMTSGSAPAVRVSAKRRPWLAAAILAAVTIAAAAAGWWIPNRLARRTLPSPPAPLTTAPGFHASPALSSDGKLVAYTWTGEKRDNQDIYVLQIGQTTPLRLTTDPAADHFPVWSPDDSEIAFFRQGRGEAGYYVVPLVGGREKKILEVPRVSPAVPVRFLDWSPDGKDLAIVDSEPSPARISLVSLATGQKRPLTSPPPHTLGDGSPKFSPDGRALAFLRCVSSAVHEFYIIPVSGGEPRRIAYSGTNPYDATWTADGRAILFRSKYRGAYRLFRLPVAGGPPELVPMAGEGVVSPAVSRRGNRLVYAHNVNDANIWRVGLNAEGGAREAPSSLIASTQLDGSADYSPDGRNIAFQSDRSGQFEIWVCDSEGQNAIQLTHQGGPYTASPRWSPDGRYLAFDSRPGENADVYVIPASGGTPRNLTADPANDQLPSWSHDGRWIYFTSNRSGQEQIWKMPAAGGGAVQVTRGGAHRALESPDGKFLYYSPSREPATLWRIPVQGGAEEQVPDSPLVAWGSWQVVERGIYYLERPLIKLFRFDNRQSVLIATPSKPLRSGDALCLAVSPDRRWLLYDQLDTQISELMLMENFR